MSDGLSGIGAVMQTGMHACCRTGTFMNTSLDVERCTYTHSHDPACGGSMLVPIMMEKDSVDQCLSVGAYFLVDGTLDRIGSLWLLLCSISERNRVRSGNRVMD